jgi:hypothetical protein
MPSTRLAGYVLSACAMAALLLLAAHPGGAAHDLQGLVKMEAAQQTPNALVHGGFILLLPLIVACQAQLARELGLDRFAALAGLTLFCAGSAFLAASLLVDGLLVPQMAARLVAGPPQGIEAARPTFLFAGTAVRVLMPLGLGIQALGAAGLALAALHLKRAIAATGLLASLVALAGVSILPQQPMMLMSAIALIAVVWNAVGGKLLLVAARARSR